MVGKFLRVPDFVSFRNQKKSEDWKREIKILKSNLVYLLLFVVLMKKQKKIFFSVSSKIYLEFLELVLLFIKINLFKRLVV